MGAKLPQRVLLLLRLRLGDHDHGLEAQCIGHNRQPDARVAGRSFDNGSRRASIHRAQSHRG